MGQKGGLYNRLIDDTNGGACRTPFIICGTKMGKLRVRGVHDRELIAELIGSVITESKREKYRQAVATIDADGEVKLTDGIQIRMNNQILRGRNRQLISPGIQGMQMIAHPST